uniref:NADH dehydrogenase subunit 6 n=1 Tax=Isorropodon fossajaponicum TaxID=1871144 RepID=A0A1B4WR18_9BIVA|nr:NADH dehydrogenase subunit 6 [Isorropodon fossajaponicum]
MPEMFVLMFILTCVNFSIWVEHPLILGGGLLIVSIVSLPFLVSVGSLFGFSFFIVVVGGVLIVFAYSVSLIPVTKKDLPFKLKFFKKKQMYCRGYLFLMFVTLFSGWCVGEGIFCWSDALYFSKGWGLGVVLLGFLLLVVMVISISFASKFKGALIK